MKRKRKNSFFKRVLVWTMAVFMVMTMNITAFATSNESLPEVAAAREGVLQIRLVYQDQSGNQHLLKTGSGFLIGASSGAVTVITNDHVIRLNDEQKEECSERYGVDFSNANNVNLLIQVVVKRDIYIDASYVNGSEQADFAILQLSQAIYDRTPLKLSDSDNAKETQPVYALGFPWVTSAVADDQVYTTADVTITNGIIGKFQNLNNIPYILHNAGISYGNSGGPLVNSQGAVVGVNTMYAGEDGNNYFYSISINEIRGALDALGIVYPIDSTVSVPEPAGTEQQPPATAVPAASGTGMAEPTISVTEPPQPVVTPEPIGSAPEPVNMMLILGIAAVLLVIILIVVFVILSGKKKKTVSQSRPMPQGGFNQIPPTPQTIPQQMGGAPRPNTTPVPPAYNTGTIMTDTGAGETSVLGLGAGETSVLGGGSSQIAATLIRIKNNETVTISKPSFSIGKERAKVDFCIPDNDSVSRVHVNIVYRGGEYYVVDNNSTNFTYINGNKVIPRQETKLNSGDKIKLSDEEFVIRF